MDIINELKSLCELILIFLKGCKVFALADAAGSGVV